jgi:Fe-S-cluster formation regulator IscX/YfhJ
MLSPYRGVMHCVETASADAVTTDGRRWTLYVRGECLYDDPAQIAEQGISVPDVKYATWSERTGLKRAPIRLPTFDDRVRHEGERLLEAVRSSVPRLPFALADRFELWLLHAGSGRPLALIDSACSPADCASPATPGWTPGQLCMEALPEAAELKRLVGVLAGEPPRAAWFERRPDGSGVRLPGQPGPGAWPADAFAGMLIDRGAIQVEAPALLEALERWQSPALLQLPTLAEPERRRLEIEACGHAERLAEQLPLYPCVLERRAVTAALVAARLRRATGEADPARLAPVAALSPDYIEVADD